MNAATASTASPTDGARVSAILQRRAEFYAHIDAGTDADDVGSVYVVLWCGRNRFALPADTVREVRPSESYTPLPFAPAALAGLAQFGGELVPLVRLGVLIGIGGAIADDCKSVAILHTAAGPVGLLADRIDECCVVTKDTVCESPNDTSGLIAGFTKSRISLLNAEALLSAEGPLANLVATE